MSNIFKKKKFFALTVIYIFILTSYVNVYASVDSSQLSILSPKQQFLMGIANSVSPVSQINEGSNLFDIKKPTELDYNIKFGESTMLDDQYYSGIKDITFDFTSRADSSQSVVSADCKIMVKDNEALTLGFYGDDDIIALTLKELYSKNITISNNDMINTLNKLGLDGFTTDKIDFSKSILNIDPEMEQRLNSSLIKYRDILIDNLDATMFKSVAETRTINNISLSGNTVTMELTGSQLAQVLKALAIEAQTDSELKLLLKDLYNYYFSYLNGGYLIEDQDIEFLLNDILYSINTYSDDLENMFNLIKVELFIVDNRIAQASVDLSLVLEINTVDFTLNCIEKDAGYDFDTTTVITQKDMYSVDQTLTILGQGSIMNITSIDKYQPLANDIKLETFTYSELSDVFYNVYDNLMFTIFYQYYELAELSDLAYYILVPPPPPVFPDVTDENYAWAREEIETLHYFDIIDGIQTNDGLVFNPGAQITRAEATKILVYAFNIYGSGTDANFTDVSSSDWYYDVVGAAYKSGIIKGTSDTTFEPNEPITREQLCTIAIRTMEKFDIVDVISNESINDILSLFIDASDISDYAKVYVATAYANGIVYGTYEDNTFKFKPLDNTTRAEAAVIVYRVYFFGLHYY